MDCFGLLPDEIVQKIFCYLDVQSLGRLQSTCMRFNKLLNTDDYAWRPHTQSLLGSNLASALMQQRSKPVLTLKDRCKVSKNWEYGAYVRRIIFRYRRCMPYIQLDQNFLYLSVQNKLYRFNRNNDGSISNKDLDSVYPHRDDICKFVLNGEELVSGGRDGTVARLKKINFHHITTTACHPKDIHTLDAKEDIIITGARDGSIKIWKTNAETSFSLEGVNASVRVISLAIMPSNKYFICGLPGIRNIAPLQLYDLETCTHIAAVGKKFKWGAGIIDIFPENSNLFLTSSYDTKVRLWDIRSPNACVSRWEDPYDNSIYCVRSDYNVTIVSGAGRNSMIQVWDKRTTRCQHVHTIRDFNSPVYCVAFDASYIFAAFDRGLVQMSFLDDISE